MVKDPIDYAMSGKVLFTERQRFRQWWLWALLLGIDGFFLWGVYTQMIEGQQFGDRPMDNAGLLLTTGLMILLTWLFANFRLETKVTMDGIYVRFFPFHLKFRYYPWDTLTKAFIRQYSPLGEYGGWGLRIGAGQNGKALNISGNKGLQLQFANNKRLLIGTNKPEELAEILDKIGQLKQ